jgi:hypothetical protein
MASSLLGNEKQLAVEISHRIHLPRAVLARGHGEASNLPGGVVNKLHCFQGGRVRKGQLVRVQV